jgi:hypothetical protein
MNVPSIAIPCWSTASFGDTADTSAMELSDLREHLDLCKASSGHLFGMKCLAEITHTFVAARFVTTLVVISVLIGVGSMMS